MRRSLHLATLVLVCAAAAPACLLNAGPIEGSGGTGAGTTTGAAGGTGPGGTGGTGGTGGMMAECGDGLLGGSEQCDDADLTAGDGCGPDCVIEPGWACGGEPSVCAQTCGDGALQQGEDCDDGDIETGDGCNQGCKIEAGWECDSSEPSQCALSCGDGTLDNGETCDDQNTDPADGCAADCQVEPGWECAQPGDDPAKPSLCKTVCGDGILTTPSEVCDDGDTDGSDGCNEDCSAVNPGWVCDDMTGGPDSCNTVCGDGIAAGTEECDDFNKDVYDGCSSTCTLEHTCGNGVVEPAEECDGGADCTDCVLAPMSVCGKALEITPGAVDPDTGVRVSHYENDSGADGVALPFPYLGIPSQDCDTIFNFPVLHSYTTGKQPSIVTVEAMEKLLGGATTQDKTVLWIYRDCPGQKDFEGCDDDAGDGPRSLLTTGFLPANTTLYIVLAGEGANGDKGPYHLQVTEQPVKLFYHEDFGPETTAGTYPLPADLTPSMVDAGAEWKTCVQGALTPCVGINLNSHSGGAFGFAHATVVDTDQSIVTISTPTVDLQDLQVARVQYTYVYNHAVGAGSGEVIPMNGDTPSGPVSYTSSGSGRGVLNMPKSADARVDFTYDDDGSTAPDKFSVDDIYIYGY